MAGEHEGLTNDRVHRVTRRKADTWDRIKFLVIMSVIAAVAVGSNVSSPFTTLGQAFTGFISSPLGAALAVLFGLEIIRQFHYALSERSSGYHQFWTDEVFGGLDRAGLRFKPWTRFRVGRFFRWMVYLAIYAVIIDATVANINGPIDAIGKTPSLILKSLPFVLQFATYLLIIVGQFGFLFWFLSRGGTDIVMPEEIKTRFSDVWGQDNVLRLLKENIAFLEKPDEIEAKGGYIPGGILLWGPPGTGKTLMAEAIAGETGRPFVFVDPGAFINMFFGVGILKVKSLYRKLRKLSLRHGGVIVFFDEADSLGSRGALTGLGMPGMAQPATTAFAGFDCNGFGFLSPQAQQAVLTQLEVEPAAQERPRRGLVNRVIMGAGMGGGGGMGTLQALLTEMNGLTKPRGFWNKVRKMAGMRPKPPPKYRILHIMATNMPNALDEAMLRPGRIDRIFKVGYPSKDGRRATLEGYLAKVANVLTPEQVEKLAVVTPYYSGAKIKDLVNEALIQAIREGREAITWPDIWKAKALKELGPPEDSEYIQRERHAVAIHEASHAVVAHLMRKHMAIDLVTIERHGDTGGMVKNLLAEDRFTQWKSEFESDIMVSLASLAGERMFFGDDNSSGVTGDLRSATAVAAYMEGVWGMGNELISYTVNQTEMGQSGNPASSALRARKEAIEARLEELYQRTWDILDEHRDKVLAIAAVLEDRKTISGDDVVDIMGTPAGFRLAREPKGWQLVDEAAAEERRRSALASLPGGPNGHASDGHSASDVATGDVDGADRTVDDQLT
jgi:ATP-dependent Zn protease